MTTPDPKADVARTALGYYDAMVRGDEAALRQLFDPRAPVVGHFDGAFQWLDLDAFIAEANGLVGQHGAEECRIEGLQVDGDIAWVAVQGRYAGLWIADHLALVRVDQRWRIVAKTFHIMP
jgi:hypothetical protein